ncbi:DNA helicase RecQ [Legionella yabuuchiae]|uniref:DNA helicase RecQ n=1 Tax=Legionella yabuuchiae TaxID=376727 RepID=UPI0010564C22|nr:DNA helicase RecQ [Legionella yabuuchiae]
MESFAQPQLSANQILKQYYGFERFRHPQEEIVNDLCAGIDLLVLMPTGGGKSLCYQIPSLVRNGVGIIVSPLIALMEDQVAALKSLGIRAAYYNSSLSSSESRKVLQDLHNQELDLLYIAPERLISVSFLERLEDCQLALFAIDEAHCISQWGHDFRPEYAALGVLKQQFPHVPIIALTATADRQTQKDIIQRLNYKPKEYLASFNRPNIHYRVLPKSNPIKQMTDFLETFPNESGIIYCGTRDRVESLASKLKDKGYRARAYHAGLPYQERREVQSLFRHDHIDIVVATIAFGMGIDKPDVRYVVHFDLPKTIESYYQETGRAGRDGLPAQALLLYDPADSGRLRGHIAALSQEAQKRIENNKLNHMLAFAEATHCRRQILLRYFDETYPNECNYCDVCDHPPEMVDATIDAQKALSCIYRLKQNYGILHVIDVLRGSSAEKIKQFGHQRLSTYGIGQDKPASFWKHLLWQLIHRDYCYQDLDHFNVLRLTQKAIPLLKGEEQIQLSVPPKPNPSKQKKERENFSRVKSPLFNALSTLRRKIANEEGKPPFMIFSDATLYEMADRKPQTLDEFITISGVGKYKLELYGEMFIQTIIAASEETTV